MVPGARYDGIADWYDDYARASPVTQTALRSVRRLLGPGSGVCLDVGCGTGVAFDTIAELGWTIVGVDLSADVLRIAGQRAAALGGRAEHADGSRLPAPDASFDAAISVLTHTDFDDAAAVFREMARVVRPGSPLVYVGVHPCFVGPMIDRPADVPPLLRPGYRRSGWWTAARGLGVRSRVGVNHLTLGELLNAIIGANWQIERVEEPTDGDYPTILGVGAVRIP